MHLPSVKKRYFQTTKSADRLPSQIVHAPKLEGRAWLSSDRDLSLEALRGKFVLLDFWTFCCINCLHVLDELRSLEHRFADELVIIGVHSPKFEHERNQNALRAAIERYEVAHPVLDDPDLLTWRAYSARAWPTLTLVDPEGFVIFSMSGEGHAPGLSQLLNQLVPVYEKRGTLSREPAFALDIKPADTPLRFPGKAINSPAGGYFVSSSAQHQIVELAADGQSVVQRIGSAERGATDGTFDTASFSEPQGLLLLPSEIAQQVGYDLVVADSVNHLLRGINLSDESVGVVAGTGKQWNRLLNTNAVLEVDLSSPWDLAWFEDKVIIAMAGIHQLWWFDPLTNTAGVYAGTTVEALGDGPISQAWMAQPSGLSAIGDTLWIADSETSALRFIRDGVISTAVGKGLLTSGLSTDPPIVRSSNIPSVFSPWTKTPCLSQTRTTAVFVSFTRKPTP